MQWFGLLPLMLAGAAAACSGDATSVDSKSATDGGQATQSSTTASSATTATQGTSGTQTTSTSGAASSAGGGAMATATTGTTTLGATTTGAAVTGQACPPCAAPPSPDCVGSGPCGCGPYTCPVAGPGTCSVLGGDYGDCEAVLGWGFDGSGCRLYSGCDCGSDCASFFASAAACATACAAEQYCNAAALVGGGILDTFDENSYCDEVYACVPATVEADVAELLPLSSACEASGDCASETCPSSLTGTIAGTDWDQVCAASLLPETQITCWVWGP